MSFSRKALLALTGFAALAMPLAVAGSASASTTASGSAWTSWENSPVVSFRL